MQTIFLILIIVISGNYIAQTADQETLRELSNSTNIDASDLIIDSTDDYRIVCYFTNWAWYRPDGGNYLPENTDANLCTHINYGFAVLDSSLLTIKIRDMWIDIDQGFYERVVALKEINPDLKVLLSLGGWQDSADDKYSRLIRKQSARRNFITTTIKFLTQYEFDGLNINWIPKCWQGSCERGPQQDMVIFPTFIKELNEAFKVNNLLLTMDVSPMKSVIDAAYDVPSLAKNLDFINLQAYDMYGNLDKFAFHHAPLHPRRESASYDTNFYSYNIHYAINYWLKKGMRKKKINLGIPFYGRTYTLKQSADSSPFNGFGAASVRGGEPGPITKNKETLAFYEICENIKNQNWTKVKDHSTDLPFAYKGLQWVGYDDIEMMKKKSHFIKALGLGGAMIWTLDFDDFSGRCCSIKWPLLKTLNAELRGVEYYQNTHCLK